MSELPYVGWSPRPLKNGQPPPCNLPNCNATFAGRKVGNALKRLPQLYYGDKVKEQIIQKWDPATQSMVTIYSYKPAIVTSTSISVNSTTLTVSWSLQKPNATTNTDVTVQLFQSSTQDTVSGSLFSQLNVADTVSCTFTIVPGYYYYATVIPKSGTPVFTNVLQASPFISATISSVPSTTLLANWTVLTPVNVSLQWQNDTNGNGVFVNIGGPINVSPGLLTYSQIGFNFTGPRQFRFILNVVSTGMSGTITSNAINPPP